MYDEIMAMEKENFVFNAYKGDDKFNSPGESATIMITVKDGYTLMSFISMIAPSPDWFVGLDSYDLCGKDGQWKDNIDMNLLPWDAGTDSGRGLCTVKGSNGSGVRFIKGLGFRGISPAPLT